MLKGRSDVGAATLRAACRRAGAAACRKAAAPTPPPHPSAHPQGATLHLWSSDDAWTSFTAHSDPGGEYSGTLSLKTGGFEVGVCGGGGGGGGGAAGRKSAALRDGAAPASAKRPAQCAAAPSPPHQRTHTHNRQPPFPRPLQSVTAPADFEALLASKFAGVPPDWVAPIAAQAAGQRPSPAGARRAALRCARAAAKCCQVGRRCLCPTIRPRPQPTYPCAPPPSRQAHQVQPPGRAQRGHHRRRGALGDARVWPGAAGALGGAGVCTAPHRQGAPRAFSPRRPQTR